MIPEVVDVKTLLKLLGYSEDYAREIARQIEHFEREAPMRDEIVEGYLDRECIDRISSEIAEELKALDRERITLLDVGAGSGTFTFRVIEKLRAMGVEAEGYGLDVTPGMLRILARRGVRPIWGVAEDIKSSILLMNNLYGLRVPLCFDAVISTFTLHHILNPLDALKSMRDVTSELGKVVVVDVLRYSDPALKERLMDVHPGFTLDEIREIAGSVFEDVRVEVLKGVRCRVEGVEVNVFKGVFVPKNGTCGR